MSTYPADGRADGPPPVGDRVPDAAPFVVRPSPWRVLRSVVIVTAGPAIVLLAVLWGLLTLFGADTSAVFGAPVAACAVVVPIVVAVLTVLVLRAGPYLACDHEGVWVRVRQYPVRAVRLSWREVGEVVLVRTTFDRVLRFTPVAPQTIAAASGVPVRQAARPVVTVLTADRSVAEITAAVESFSGGRHRVTVSS